MPAPAPQPSVNVQAAERAVRQHLLDRLSILQDELRQQLAAATAAADAVTACKAAISNLDTMAAYCGLLKK